MEYQALKCPNCGAPLEENPKFCSHCGVSLVAKDSDKKKGFLNININTNKSSHNFSIGTSSSPANSEGKTRSVTLLLAVIAIFTMGISLHRLYLKKIGDFVLSIIFIWTFIPLILAILDALKYYPMTDEEFLKLHP